MLGRVLRGGEIIKSRLSNLAIIGVIGLAAIILAAVFVQYRRGSLSKSADHISLPSFHHVVIVVEENRPFEEIIGSAHAPFINQLASEGALFLNSYGVTNASQPNYLALISGSTHDVEDNEVHPKFPGPTLLTKLRSHGLTFSGYSEGLPFEGSDVESSGDYKRKHNPMTQFEDIPPSANKIFNEKTFPTAPGTNYSFLPTVSMVVPDQQHDMHDGDISEADVWLKENLGSYIEWAKSNNSLLILTFDEDGTPDDGRIVTVFYGARVRPGKYSQTINHYNVLRTLEDMYGLEHSDNTSDAAPITGVWK